MGLHFTEVIKAVVVVVDMETEKPAGTKPWNVNNKGKEQVT